jgi:hypothetical protein
LGQVVKLPVRLRLPYLEKLAALHEALVDVRQALYRVELQGRPPPLPGPFVCAFVEATKPSGQPTTLGASGRASENGTVLEIQPNYPLTDVRLTVFADLDRVSIHGIFLGMDIVTAALGDCPIAHFDDWQLGVKLRVQCLVRHAITK